MSLLHSWFFVEANKGLTPPGTSLTWLASLASEGQSGTNLVDAITSLEKEKICKANLVARHYVCFFLREYP